MSDASPGNAPPPGGPATTGLIAALTAAVLILYGLVLAFSALPCVALLGLAVLVAAPIWLYLSQRALLTRHAIIRYVSTESGYIQRWFWAGSIKLTLMVFVALALATVLLILMTSLQPAEWLVLAADAILLGLLFNPVRRSLGRQIGVEHQGLVARLWPMALLNVVVLVIAFVVLNLYSAHTVIQGTWIDVAKEAYSRGGEGVACPAAAALLGTTAAIDQLAWKAAIASIPYLPDRAAKIVGWAAFLAWTGFAAVLFTQFMLGVVAWLDERARTRSTREPGSTFWRAFVVTILVLAVPYLYVNWKLSKWELPLETFKASLEPLAQAPVDPCAAFHFDTSSLQSTLTGTVDEARLQTHQLADRRIDAMLDTAFGKAEKGVDAYLDWYFSLYGDYSRLFAVMVGDLGQVMHDNLAKHVFDDTGFAQVIESETSGIQQAITDQMTGVASRLPEKVRQAVDLSKCPIPSIDTSALINLDKDRIRAAVSTTSALTVGTVTAKTLGKKAAAAAASKAAASGSVKMAAKIAGKAVAKKGASTLAAAGGGTLACAAAGPVAIVCGIAAGVITWVAVDKAAIELEELVSRDDMRTDLMKALSEQRAAMEKELKTVYHGIADAYAVEINARADEVFIPARDGI